jgi:hypothetical protein
MVEEDGLSCSLQPLLARAVADSPTTPGRHRACSSTGPWLGALVVSGLHAGAGRKGAITFLPESSAAPAAAWTAVSLGFCVG